MIGVSRGFSFRREAAAAGAIAARDVTKLLRDPIRLVGGLIFPALFISVTVLAFNLLVDGLRDALDARMRSRE